MTRKYTRHTKENIAKAAAESNSIAELLRKLDLVVAGGNYTQINRNLDKFQIDTSHFTGQGHNRGKSIKCFDKLTSLPAIKKRLIQERSLSCELCGNTQWMSQVIPIEVDHIDGNNRNNNRNNLRLICPNCHAQTNTYRNRKRT